MTTAVSDILQLVEAAYALELPRPAWVRQLAETALPHLDDGFGVAAFEFQRCEGKPPNILSLHQAGIPEDLARLYPVIFREMDPGLRMRPFTMGPCVTGSQLMGQRDEFRADPHMRRYAQRFGMYDSIWITAADLSGRGVGLHAGRSKIAWATTDQTGRWGRVAAHIAAALRLRHKLGVHPTPDCSTDLADAIMQPDGALVHAVGEASQPAEREALRRAVIDLEASRGAMRGSDPDAALGRWRVLVSGRWSLLEEFEQSGHRYIIARQNVPEAHGPAALTAREQQVLNYLKLGHHTKLIAYELGIADATVRVLVARAAKKLGARTRDELLRAAPDVFS